MDYYSLPRKQLQALCKKHGIPANSTNVSMADALTAMLSGDGNIKPLDEGFQKQQPVSQDRGVDSVLTEVSNTPRRCTRSKRLAIAEEDESAEEPVVIEIEGTPAAPKGKGAKSANKTLERRLRTRAGSRKVLDVDIVNKDGSLHSSEVDESSDSVTALNSVKVERSGPVKGNRNARTSKTKYCCRTDGNEDVERLEYKQGSDEKGEKTDKTDGELVEEAPKTRTKGRSSRKKVDKVEVEEAIEDSSIQGEDDASKNEMTPIGRRSTRARASKVVDAHPSQNRSSSIKKTGNAESIKKTPVTVRKARVLKLSPMTESLTDNEDQSDQAEEVLRVPTKKSLLAKANNSYNNDVKSPVHTRRALRNSQKDPTGILSKDALEESASKVKRVPTLRGRNSVRNAHQVIGSETQEESNSESEGSNVKQERESYRKITRKAVRKNLGKDKHKCTEEIDVPQADLNAKDDKEVVENKAPEYLESIDETESEEMKSEIIVQPELTMCQNFDQKHASFDISQTESSDQVENKSIAEVSSRSSKDYQSSPISELYGSRIVKELNVYSGKLSMEHGIVSAGMTPLSMSVEGKFDSLPSVDQLGAPKVQDSSCLKCSADSMVAEVSPIEKDAFTSSVEARVGELIGIGEKMVNDGVNVAESHNGIKSVTMPVDIGGEDDASFSHIVYSLKIEETKETLHHNDHKMNNFNTQELQCGRDLSSSSAEAASPVEEKEDVMHSESNNSSMEATRNLFEVQEKVAVLALNTSGEEFLDPKAVYSSDLKIVGEQTELQLIPTNLVEETNQNTTEANLQDGSFFIDEVSDLEDTDEKNQNAQDSDLSLKVVSDIFEVQDREITVSANGESQVLEASEKIQSGEDCQDVEEEIASDLDSTGEENQDVQDSDLSFKVASDISQAQDREVTVFANGEGQVLEASEKIKSGEDCQDVEEEISSNLDSTGEENQDFQNSDLSFKVSSDISQVQDRSFTVFANGEGQILEASEKIESGEDCQDVEEEISSDLDSTGEEKQDVQDSDLSFKVASDVSQVQDREVTGFANYEGQVLEASEMIESGEDCQHVGEEILRDLYDTKVENQDAQDSDHSFKVVSNILQIQNREVTGFANVERQDLKASKNFESGEACRNTEEGKLHALTSLPEETKDSATERKSDIGNTLLLTRGNTLLLTRQSFEEESTGLGIAKQDQEACNDTVEGKQTSQSSQSDNVSEAVGEVEIENFSSEAAGEVEIENFSFESDGRQKEADQAQGCISYQRIEGSNVLPQSCSTEVLVYSNAEDFVIAIQKHGTSNDDRTIIGRDRKLDVFNENSVGGSDCVPLLSTKVEANMQNQISHKHVSPTANLEISVASACQPVNNIDCLESEMMATVKSFETGNEGQNLETGNEGQNLGVEITSALPVEKYLPGLAAQGSEQTNIKETEFSVEASYEAKMPFVVEDTSFHPQDASGVDTLCEKINCMSLDGVSQELSSSNSPLALTKPYPVEKAPNTLIKNSRQQRNTLTDLVDGRNTILNDVFQNASLESERCELQIGKENPQQLNALSLRKLRALLKKKNIPRNNGQKEGERFVLRDLTSIELEKRNKVPDNTQL